MTDDTTLTEPDSAPIASSRPQVLALVAAWSTQAPERAGEHALIESAAVLGRGEGDTTEARVLFSSGRPGETDHATPFQARTLSRRQLRLVPQGDTIEVERLGRARTLHNGREVSRCSLQVGDTLRIGGDLVLACVQRPIRTPELRYFRARDAAEFGRADRFGIVGEGPRVWAMRDKLAFAALSDTHVLVLGQSGVGKELAARALHAISGRSGATLVARNASTLPSSIASAELFGNRRDYPNAGTPDRPGLVGSAHGGTLFLDELGELPDEAQSQLLRVLDAGEYQRLGEGETRHADVRVIGATNRPPSALRDDLFARFKVRLTLPPLDERREDIPLLCRHLVIAAAERSPELAARYLRDTPRGPQISMSAALADALLRHHYPLNVRELDALLWEAMAQSPDDTLALTKGVEAMMRERPSSDDNPLTMHDADGPSREDIVAALRAENGNRSQAAERLGLSSRFVLYRLMKAHGLG